DREPTTRPTRTSHELDRPTIGQQDRFLPVRLPNILHQSSELRPLPLILEETLEPKERLPGRLHLVGRVQDPPTDDDHLEQLHDLYHAVLAVLPCPRHATPARSQPAVRCAPKPRRHNLGLPR